MKKLFVLSILIVFGTIAYAQDHMTSNGYIRLKNNGDYYFSEDGIIFINNNKYNDHKVVLVKFPQNKNISSYTIPNGVNSIAKGAFQGNKYLKTIRIPSSIIYIGDNAFDGCDQLQSIEMYESTSAVRAVEMDESPSEAREVGRYNIQGVKVQEDEEGQVQIILYSDGTSKKVIK